MDVKHEIGGGIAYGGTPTYHSFCIFCNGYGLPDKPETIKHKDWCSHRCGTLDYPDQYILRVVR
jgi:cytochrome c5